MRKIIKFLRRCWWWNRSTKIKLWSTETIGYSGGYYECHSEQNAADLAYMDSWLKPGADEAEKLWKIKCEKIKIKYFGPKYIRA